MPNLYASLGQLKTHMGVSDTVDDARLLRILEAVSRDIDMYCRRQFFVSTDTRYFSSTAGGVLHIDDLLSVTTLSTDESEARTYTTTWLTTDYDLEPYNALSKSPPQPYVRLCVTPLSTQRFYTSPKSIRIVGKWGYYEILETSSTTVAEALDSSETGVDVASGAALSVGQTIKVDDEQMYISAISTNTLTVQRGVNGTTAAAHLTASAIQVYTYPVINEACIWQAALNHLTSQGATGTAGVGDFEQPIRQTGLHPFVQRELNEFRKLEYV